MKRRNIAFAFVLVLVVHCSTVQAQWAEVAPGISYRDWTLPGPLRVFVARADRARDNWTLDTMIGQGSLKSGMETVPGMVERYNDSVNFQGQRYEIKAAVNGDYYNMRTGVPPGQIISGWFAKRFPFYGGGSGFVWTRDRRGFLGGDLVNDKKWQRVVFADSAEMEISNINGPRGGNELVLYTCHYADKTYTSPDGVEVLVRMSSPMCIMPSSRDSRGEIVKVRNNAGSTPIPFDHVVLSGHGKAAQQLLAHAKVGQQVHIDLRLKDYGIKSVALPPQGWRKAYASIGGACECVVDGKVPSEHWEAKAREKAKAGVKYGAVLHDPRTTVAMNDHYVYFIVVDGRSKQSTGMTFKQVGNFCVDHLKATYAITQDGGGSSTMWVDGKIMNVPSDGRPRPVANGYMMAIVHEPKKAGTFSAGDRVSTKGDVQLRLGPGTHYAVAATVPNRRTGVIVEHPLNGIRAKSANWWKCKYEDLQGWVPQAKLARSR